MPMTLRKLHEHLGCWLENSHVDPDAEVEVELVVARVLIKCPLVDTSVRHKPGQSDVEGLHCMKVVLVLQ